jgi:hypothetical protein
MLALEGVSFLPGFEVMVLHRIARPFKEIF